MKKIILVVVTFCACLTACGGTKENYALVETAYDNLRSKDEISYEVQYTLGQESETQTYVVNQQGDDWSYELYIGTDMLLQERKYEKGNQYVRYNGGQWLQDSVEYKLPFLDEILVDSSQIEHVVVHDKDVTEIVITLNQKALDEMRNTAILLGEEAINNLINMGVSDDAINAQKEHNLLLERTTYHNDERKYYMDENGVLIKYMRTVMLEQPNMENELEEEQINITISINK